MKLSIGISPCPNDTFIFDAIYSKKINIEPFEFDFVFEDVEKLNQFALQNKLDIVKLSYANYFNVQNDYVLLRSGGALGYGVGPLLVAKKDMSDDEINQARIAIPGSHTTANFLFTTFFPNATNKVIKVFSDIENAVLSEEVDAGLLIHEGRFSFAKKGLTKLMDLGEQWQTKTQLPIPLGGIAIKKNVVDIHSQINQLIANSIQFANANYPPFSSFILDHAQEMELDVIKQHIDLYVNDFSLDITNKGVEAIEYMKNILSPKTTLPLFIQI